MHHTFATRARARFALSPVALVASALLQGMAAHAQTEDGQPALRASPMLSETVPPEARGQQPTFIEGDSITGQTDLQTVVEGNASLRRGDTRIQADRLRYNQPDDMARAEGNVRVNRAGNVFEGPLLELKVDSFEGFFNTPRYRFLRNDAYGEAERVDFLDDKHSIIRNATYTTCQRKPGPSWWPWSPDWILRASTISIDNEEETGVATNAVLSFFHIPILPAPVLSFPLTDARKSGLLPPVVGVDNISGVEITQPYYWNIAPNRDATFFPTLMSKRGLDLGGEFRYLEKDYSGILRADYMPTDKLRNQARWAYAYRHDGSFATPLPGMPSLGLSLNLNRVSDDNYWRDFSRSTASLTQRLLASEGTVSWAAGDLSASARVVKWQTLQDAAAPIAPPFDLLPQFSTRYVVPKTDLGLEGSLDGNYTRYTRTLSDPNNPNAHRSLLLAQMSRPWLTPGWFVTPKVQLHSRRYEFDSTLLTNGARSAVVNVPTMSVDSGLIFERDTTLFGRNFRQTLEPRAFYVYTPFRNQNFVPNYDSAYNDFNFSTIYTENAFSGNDRISDNNLLTLGASSALLDADSGAETARLSVAQRVRFSDQRVTLGGPVVSDRLSDVLLGATINVAPRWAVDSVVQYNPKTERSVRSTIGAHYHPANYRVVSAAYRYQRDASEQLELGWQWPINDLWGDRGSKLAPGMGDGDGRLYSVGRVNMSLRDKRVVDSVLGLEYDAGCWLGRVVFERFQTSATTSNKRILFQLEFVGFTRVGSNALKALQQNVPRYQFLREQVTTPSRFSNYE